MERSKRVRAVAPEVRNPKATDRGVECEINHPRYGWIPFHATPDDPVDYGRELFAELAAERHGKVEGEVPSLEDGEESVER